MVRFVLKKMSSETLLLPFNKAPIILIEIHNFIECMLHTQGKPYYKYRSLSTILPHYSGDIKKGHSICPRGFCFKKYSESGNFTNAHSVTRRAFYL